MTRFALATISDQRAFGGLRWLRLSDAALASRARPGQYVLLRCAPAESADPLLRRALFVAGADRATGTIDLLYAPDERGLRWLDSQQPGGELDLFGPLGKPLELNPKVGNLLLLGEGPGLPALRFLAAEAVAKGINVVLLAAAPADTLPPPFLFAPEVEYQTAAPNEPLLALVQGSAPNRLTAMAPIQWADQICAALPDSAFKPLADAVRTQRLRWQPGFATALIARPMPCGTGACLGCLVETRDGWQAACKDGPAFDLRRIATS